MCEYMREGLENARSADIDKSAANRIADELRAFTAALIEPDAIALYRLLVADGWRSPELARVFDQSGMQIIRRRIAELLQTGGVPANKSPQVAAELVALALGDGYQRATPGIVERGDGEVFARQLEVAVLHGFSQIAGGPAWRTRGASCVYPAMTPNIRVAATTQLSRIRSFGYHGGARPNRVA